MIKALLLIFKPVPTWEAIKRSDRSPLFVFFFHVLPLLFLTCAAEGFGLVHWKRSQLSIPMPRQFPVPETIVYALSQVLVSLVLVFICALLVKAFAETFRARHTFKQSFTVMAYGLSPLFLLRVVNAVPVPPWLGWVFGILLSIGVLYHGVPRIMDPDPPQAFGLYFTTAILVVLLAVLVGFPAVWYIWGQFPALASFYSDLGAKLPL